MAAEALEELIVSAFSSVPRPPADDLVRGRLGDEPFSVEAAFRDISNWRTLDAKFLDTVPDGLSSALSFLSDAAFRFFLPAYLLADLRGQLERVDVVFHLSHGLSEKGRMSPVSRQQMEKLSAQQCRAVVGYLEHKVSAAGSLDLEGAADALNNFWYKRLAHVSS
jgi:hypothetical protein